MFRDNTAFSSFGVDDIEAARAFYGDKLGLDVRDAPEPDLIELHLNGTTVMVYPRPDHTPAAFTVLNFLVDDVEAAVDGLNAAGIEMARFGGFEQDEKGIASGEGPTIAWFRDPAGNIIAILNPGS